MLPLTPAPIRPEMPSLGTRISDMKSLATGLRKRADQLEREAQKMRRDADEYDRQAENLRTAR